MDKALVASAVVVWEWLGERGRWRPYSPAVSRHIEEVIRSEPRGGSVVLGQADSRLSPYIIDIQSMHQFRQDTGTLRPVRRSFYDPTSAPGQGWIWEWENDKGSWTPFDMEVTIALQVARERQQSCLDLTSLGFNHVVDFQTMTQINRQTQTQRRVQRRLDSVYPLISGPLPKSSGANASTKALLGVGVSGSMLYKKSSAPSGSSLALPGLPCTCPQCLLVQSVKANANGSQTLGRSRAAKRSCPKQYSGTLPSSSASLTTLNSKSHMQNAKSLDSSFLEEANHPTVFDRSLALLNTRSLSHGRPVLRSQPHLPSPAPKSASSATFVPTAILVNTSPDDTSHFTSLPSQRPTVSAAPLPARASLARLSPPALRRIAMAQSQALISSGVPTVQVKNLEGSGSVRPALAGITGILMSAAGLPVCLTRPPQPDLNPPPVSKSDIKPVPGITSCCRKISKKQVCKGKTPEEVVKTFLQKVKMPPDEDCTICMGSLLGPSGYMGLQISSVSRAEHVAKLAQCGHLYHLQCLVTMYVNGNKDGSLQCPTCKMIYGVKMGNQPPGKMEYHVIPHSLPGHPDCRTIRIIYNIPPGLQSPEHPNPGKPFTSRGFPRHCYLPDSEKGRKVLRLLLSAWDRRMIFSVATSSTTGEPDTVIWNDIHHKTEFGSNFTGHGYPDSGYLDNVLEELKAQGITEELGKQP